MFALFSHLSFTAAAAPAPTYQLVPESNLSSSNCVPQNTFSCSGYGFNPQSDCTANSVDAASCQEMKFYTVDSVTMVEFGDSNTEGAYVTCTGGTNDFTNCTTKGAFSITTDYTSATPNINKIASPIGGGTFVGGPYYCPLTRCDVRTEDMWFKVNSPVNEGNQTYLQVKNSSSSNISMSSLYPAFSTFDPSAQITYNVAQIGNNLCVFATSDVGQLLVGCKQYPSTYVPPTNTSSGSCFSNTACASQASANSKVFWSFSSKVVECVRDVLSIVFISNDTNPNCTNLNFLPGLQNGLRNTVMVALVLYVVLFGIKLVTSGKMTSKGEFFMFILKFALVLYFSVGLLGADGNYHNGLTDLIYPGGMAAMTSFSDFVMSASSSSGLCYYDPSQYNDGYQYLALWDSLDCRVAYYLGLYLVNPGSGGVVSGIYGILGTIIPAFFSLEIVFVILIIVYGIFVLSVAVYFVHFYVIAMIFFAITVYIGVIIVPLALFSYTKDYFDSWLKLIISYVIQPVIVTAFMAMMLLMFDMIVYGNCNFTANTTSIPGYTTWTMDGTTCSDANDPRCCQGAYSSTCSVTDCQSSLGWIFLGSLSNSFVNPDTSAIFFDYTTIDASQVAALPTLIETLLKVLLFIYLLSLFGEDLGGFAERLTDGINIGQFATDPGKLFESIMKKITEGAKKAANSDKGGGGGDGVNVQSGGSKARGGVDVAAKK